METDHELILENARSISEGLWRTACYAQNAAEWMDAKIDGEELDSQAHLLVRGEIPHVRNPSATLA